jgi:hypothetical protein
VSLALHIDTPRLNLSAIEGSLRAVQRDFARINASLKARRDPLDDVVLENMLAGYRCVDGALATGSDLFEIGNSGCLLELNKIVLCGPHRVDHDCEESHLEATKQHFYGANGGGVGDLMEWLAMHREEKVWRRTAGFFTQMLAQPQLFIEGNHRTGALLMSYMLASEGHPPFVLTVDNAKAFFDPATLLKNTKKHGFDELLRLPKLTKRLARVVKDTSDDRYLSH